MADSEKGPNHQPPRWVLFVLVSGLASLVFGNELRYQLVQLTRNKDLTVWQNLKDQKWDPNTATLAELEMVPGLGPKLATSILETRKSIHFQNLEDLGKIKGFGPQRLGLIEPWFHFSGEQKDQIRQGTGPVGLGTKTNPMPKGLFPKPLDPNLASAEELETIPGIGPKLAQKIVTERQIKKFDSLEDLIRVSGIGPKNLEKLRPYLIVPP